MMDLEMSWSPEHGYSSLQMQSLTLTLGQQVQIHEQLGALWWELRVSLQTREVRQLNQGRKIKSEAGLKIKKNKIKINYIN